MKKRSIRKFFRYTALMMLMPVLVLQYCAQRKKKSEVVWDQNFSRIGSQSSPRATDLNADGVLDIIVGAGQNEYQHSAQGILALDGKTGNILWQQQAEDQVYGSATCYDINGDGVADIFIGGRSPHFRALDGKSGKILWEYQYRDSLDPVMRHVRFNFNNSILVPDQNADGLMDILTTNGGNSKAGPYSTDNRFPGVLVLFESKTGKVLAADTMPDGRETYMSPLCFTPPGGHEPVIIFGTGGETLSGNLYKATLSDLLGKKLSRATVLASEQGHGFIAPPVAADINGDAYPDIVAISHGSTVIAIDGKRDAILWRKNIPSTESSNSFAVGYFTDDDVPDFFTFVSRGQWPNSTGSLQVLFDGRDGRIAFMDSIGCTGFSSPVAYDIDHDGRDEAILSVNVYDCALGFTGKSPREIENRLIAINFRTNTIQTIDQQRGFKNVFSTPWIGDMDDDGYLDIISCQYFHYGDLLHFMGMRVKRIDTPIRMRGEVRWGSYMGSRGDGLLVNDK